MPHIIFSLTFTFEQAHFLRKKWRGTLPDDPRELKKASDALARRGYSWSDIVEGLRRYGAEAESDE